MEQSAYCRLMIPFASGAVINRKRYINNIRRKKMRNKECYNSSGCLDMTAYLAIRNIENEEGGLGKMRDDWYYRRGDIYLANLGSYYGSEQGGTRPVLVLQNNAGNYFCQTLIVAPLTTHTWKKRNQPTHYMLENVKGLDGDSVVLLEQITTIDKRRVKKYLGKVTREQMNGVSDAVLISLGQEIPEEVEAP